MVEKTKNGAEKKGTPLYVKIFIALFAGIAFGYVLNFMGGVENEIINGYVLPFFQFIGDLFIKLIKMIVVPLVFFCIIDAALSLGDIKKLRSIGVKTIIWFLATGGISATIDDLVFMKQTLERVVPGSTWSAFGVGKGAMEIMYAAIAAGGNIRVGMEDNVVYKKGQLAESNMQLIARARRVIEEFGYEVATPDEARQILGLKK